MTEHAHDGAQRARSGRIAAIVILLFAGAYALAAGQIEYAFSSDPIGPKGFPLLLAALLAMFAVVYLVRPGSRDDWPNASGLRSIVAFMSACVLAMVAMAYIGFIPAMAVLMGFVSWLFGASVRMAVIGGVVQAIVWWALFGPLVGHSLPKGPLGI